MKVCEHSISSLDIGSFKNEASEMLPQVRVETDKKRGLICPCTWTYTMTIEVVKCASVLLLLHPVHQFFQSDPALLKGGQNTRRLPRRFGRLLCNHLIFLREI